MLNRLKYERLPRELKKRWSYEAFLSYRMQEMNIAQIEELVTEDELWDREKLLNAEAFRNIFNDKKEFFKRFHDDCEGRYVKRDILFLEDSGVGAFREFCSKYEKTVLKPVDKYAGLGIRIIDRVDAFEDDFAKLENEFTDLKASRYIAEEYVHQAKEYSDIYNKCLNTIRVTTFVKDGGEAGILFAVNQFGQKGSVVDNHDDAAIWASIDVDTGIVTGAEVEALDGRVYDFHPDTGARILGFENPCWAQIRDLAIELAGVVPECRLIGWDIAVRDDYSLEVIEGNVTPELNLYQSVSGNGLRTALGI
ncbi:MAG: hypothetical protein MJ104_09385 [Lachnospiraceae bacterium]|nr:hypothetical protein [Lachnospiraceae bacterium]